jgi:hypothetical protein
MGMKTPAAHWMRSLFLLGLAAGLAGMTPVFAGEAKKKADDAATEAAKAAQEDAEELADRKAGLKGKRQLIFHGTFLLTSDPAQTNPAVVGTFVTDETDKVPGQTYLVKVDNGNKDILDKLRESNAKKIGIFGKLRNENKYLIVQSVLETGATPATTPIRRSRGGI